MDRKTIAIDLAKDVFELAIDSGGTVTRERLTRNRFLQYIAHLAPAHIVMEACGSAHHWAHHLKARDHDVIMLPAQHVKPYRRGSKTSSTCTGCVNNGR